ncbi:MAG: hypothetical protein K0R98_158 [Rickettsiaceae bacterium]|jgi:hypothetical protein|nr:hypothetical protein [Rickettsiaceae bacterium]
MNIKLLLAITTIASSLFSNAIIAAEPSATKIEPDSKSLVVGTTEEQQNAAENLLQKINYALVEVGAHNSSTAANYVDSAIDLNNLLKNSTPEYRIKKQIKVGKFSYNYENKYKQRYFPISQETAKWKEYTTGPFWANEKGIAVKEADIVTVSITVDTTVADKKLKEAKEDIQKGNFKDAEEDLSELVNSMTYVEKTEVLPLEKASDNIALARYFLRAGNYDAARHSLKNAKKGLKEAQKDKRYSKFSTNIDSLSNDIEALDSSLAKKDPTMLDKTESKLKDFWQSIENWVK